jgi:hypothetical protein
MTDGHLRLLHATAARRARQLRAHRTKDGESAAASTARQGRLEALARRAREQLDTALARRRDRGDGGAP